MKMYLGNLQLSRYSDGLWSGRLVFDYRQVQEIILYFTQSRPALGPTESSIQWEPCAPSVDKNSLSVKLTSRLQLVRGQEWWRQVGVLISLWLSKGILFLQDNAAAHKAAITQPNLTDLKFEVLKYPAYSPDLAPSDYDLLPNLSIKPKTYQPPRIPPHPH
jgi:hypothetical protein